MAENRGNDVFVSFSFKDFDIVKKIVKTLEEKYGLKVWMCSEELHGGDEYFAIIPAAIREAKVFLFITSQNSLQSKEVPAEFKIARNAEKVIIPFLIDNAEIEDSKIEYFLVTLNYIDGTVPTFEKRIDELSQSIFSNLSGLSSMPNFKVTPKERLLPTKSPFPTKTFVGRKEVEEEIASYFEQGYRTVFLSGIGGIGKTQIAKKYAFDHRSDFDTIIYATYEGDLMKLVNADSPFAIEPRLIRKMKENGELESEEEYFKRKLEKIKSISDERTLIILDNLDATLSEEEAEFLDGPYRLIVTSRLDYSSSSFPCIKIKALESKDELYDLFFRNYEEGLIKKDDPELYSLLEMVNFHTYAIKLLAKHLEMSCQNVKQIKAAFNQKGLLSLDEEVMDADMSSNVAYKNLLKLYSLSGLKEDEVNALRFLLFVDKEGLPGVYCKMWGGETLFKTIKSLERRSWVIRGNTGYCLHPIVYSIAKKEIEVSYPKCADFLSRFDSYLANDACWSFLKAEKDLYASFGYKVMEFFPEINSENEDLYYDIETLLSFSVDAKASAALAKRLYDYHKARGVGDYKTARSAYKLGWDYIFNRFLPDSVNKAVLYEEEAYQRFESLYDSLDTMGKIVYYNALRHIAKAYQFAYEASGNEEDFQKALHYATLTLEKINQEKDEFAKKNRLGSMLIQACDVYLSHKDYEIALRYVEESYIAEGEVDTDILYRHTRKAKCLFGLGRYEEALELATIALAGFYDKDGRFHMTTLETNILCRDCYLALGQDEKAKGLEGEITVIRNALYA